MADYNSPTVVTPTIPETDMTPLERLILAHAFNAAPDSDGRVYFHAWSGPSSVILLSVRKLREAFEQSKDTDSSIRDHIAAFIEKCKAAGGFDDDDYVDVDLTAPEDICDRIFQDIVRRSEILGEIVITAAWTCTKMRPDGFGGSVTRITGNTTQYASTIEMLENMRNEMAVPSSSTSDDHKIRGRLDAISETAGWDGFTLLLLIARWLSRSGQADVLIDYLNHLASQEDG